jgi:ribosomal protein S18 acetylase RimI-like enzyme
VEANGDRVGFLLLTTGKFAGAAKVIQVAVQQDARRHEYASALIAEAESLAIAASRTGISLAVAEDLEATAFWDALGYQLRFRYAGGQRRGRVLERRYKLLPNGLWGNESANTAQLEPAG